MTTASPDFHSIKESLREYALDQGFDVCGFGLPQIPEQNRQRYSQFIERGEHGTMAWMENRLDKRTEPTELWDQVRSVMVVGQNYAPSDTPRDDWAKRLADPNLAHVSAYARGRDYHDVLKKRLKQVGRWFCQQHSTLDADIKVFVDTAPVAEKVLAQMAGIGWQGKHTNLVSRDFGSYLFLGVMYHSLPLPPDDRVPYPDQCGTCTACIDVCPTGAIESPYRLNATKCIAYWNVEHKLDRGAVPPEIANKMGNRVFGCDDCLAVCPWNKFATGTSEPAFISKNATSNAKIDDIMTLDDQAFRDIFRQTAVKRVGRDKFLNNCEIAAANAKS